MSNTYNYLIVIHIPYALDDDGSVLTGDLWIKDLRGMSENLGPITIAAPLVPKQKLTPAMTGSFSFAKVPLHDPDLCFLPLPHYVSGSTFLRHLLKTIQLLNVYVKCANLLHVDTGGWPVPQGEIALFLARWKKRRVVAYIGDGGDPIGQFKEKWRGDMSWLKKLGTYLLTVQFNRFCRYASRRADLVLFHNPVTEQRFARYARRHYTFVRTFVDRRLLPSRSDVEERMKRLAEDRPLRFLMAGRLIRMKGVDHAIEAVRCARQRGAQVELTIVGSGAEEGRLRKQVLAADLGGVVRFRGAVDYGEAFFELLRSHDALLVCNLTDELSRNVLLGLALGCVLLTYSNPALGALVRHGDNGCVCKRGSVDSLTDGIVTLCANRKLCQSLLIQGLRTASEHTFEACHKKRAELTQKHLAPRKTVEHAAAAVNSGVDGGSDT